MNKELIAAVALLDHQNYRAHTVYNAVAGLMKSSKEEALDLIEAYLEDHREAQSSVGLFILLRSLFIVGEDETHPVMHLGKPDLSPPAKASGLPLFPCLMANDVPFLIVSGYFLGGLPETVADHIAKYRKIGAVRKTLREYPESWDEIEGEFTRQWKAAYDTEVPQSVMEMVNGQF